MFNKKVTKSKAQTKPKPQPQPEPVIRKRQLKEARETWLDFFSSALTSLLTQFLDEEENPKGQHNWDRVSERLAKEAATVADAALNEAEERFPGL